MYLHILWNHFNNRAHLQGIAIRIFQAFSIWNESPGGVCVCVCVCVGGGGGGVFGAPKGMGFELFYRSVL